MKKYKITATIKFLTGALAGLELPNGFEATYASKQSAEKALAFLKFAKAIKATGTSAIYEVVGEPKLWAPGWSS